MICKQCGAEMASSANKCKRCGAKIPAKSDCGGFYDLASAGTKMWEDSKPVAPAPVPVHREVTPPVPVYKTKPFMALTVVAAVLAILLLVSLLTKCSSDDTAAPYTPPASNNSTEPSGDPSEPSEPSEPADGSFDLVAVVKSFFDGIAAWFKQLWNQIIGFFRQPFAN